jgi:hypothetical protein
MAANSLTLEAQINSQLSKEQSDAFGKKIGIFASLFGCSHSNLTRPFSQGSVGYRTCLQCGARAKFDLDTRKTSGSFYYPPPVVH